MRSTLVGLEPHGAGSLLVLVVGLIRVGGIDGLHQRLREVEARQARAEASQDSTSDRKPAEPPPTAESSVRHTRMILPVDAPTPFPWPAIYIGLAWILSPGYWIGNKAIIQRSLGARSEFEAKASYIWGALLKNVIPLIVAMPGLIALAVFPALEDGDLAFRHLVSRLMPAGLRGLFVAALMSSIDSYLNSAATIVSHDLYKRFINPEVSPERLLTVGRVTTVGLVIWAIVFAFALIWMSEATGIYAIFQTLMAFFQGPALAVLLRGVFWRRETGSAALIGLLARIETSISLYLLNQPYVVGPLGMPPLFQIAEPYLYFSIWAFLVNAALTAMLSLVTRPEPNEKTAYVLPGLRRDSADGSRVPG